MRRNKTNASFTAKVMLAACSAAVLMPQALFADNATAPEYVYAVQQQAQVKGNVVDEFGEPMIGVTVRVKGTQAATITDLDGNFTINAKPGQQIELSYVGYLTQTVKAENGLKINMKPDSQMMEEVVVIGFGTVKKRDVTGSVAQVKSDAILQAPTSDVSSALQGRISGLDVNDGELRIRGNRSINGKNDPLVIIDGVQGARRYQPRGCRVSRRFEGCVLNSHLWFAGCQRCHHRDDEEGGEGQNGHLLQRLCDMRHAL